MCLRSFLESLARRRATISGILFCCGTAFGDFKQSAALTSAPSIAAQDAPQKTTSYTLAPDRYQRARELSRIYFRFAIIGFLYGLVVLWLILRWRLAPKYRDWAERSSSKRLVQAMVFSPLLILTMGVLELPTRIYLHSVSRKYGISVQGWKSWSLDWGKEELIAVIVGTIFIMILYTVIRRSPRRWWFYFWLVSLPIGLFMFFLQPLVVDPLFHKFAPLVEKDPVLTAALEQMVHRAGESIPRERMFWMGAAGKIDSAERICDRRWWLEAHRGVGHDDRQNDDPPDRFCRRP